MDSDGTVWVWSHGAVYRITNGSIQKMLNPGLSYGHARHEARGLLASGSYEGLIVHTDAGEVVFQDTKRGGPWWALDFHPDGRRVVGVNDWGTVECFDLDQGSASGARRFRMRPAEMFNTHPTGRTSLRPVTMAGSLNSTRPETFNSNGKPMIAPSEAWRTHQMAAGMPPPPVMPPVHFGIDQMASPLVGTGPTQASGMWNGCSLAFWPLPARPGPSESSTKKACVCEQICTGTPAWSGGLEYLPMGDRWSRARSTMICVSGPTSSRWKPPVTPCCTAKMVDVEFFQRPPAPTG